MVPVMFSWNAVGNEVSVVWVVGGKLLRWAVVPALVYGLWRGRRRELRYLLPAAAIGAAWLPWGALDRFALFYYLLPALPFAAILVITALGELRSRWVPPVYVVVSLLLFAVTYPVLASVPLARRTLYRYGDLLGVSLNAPSARVPVNRDPLLK